MFSKTTPEDNVEVHLSSVTVKFTYTECTQVHILENTALKYGGGICVDSGSVPEMIDFCFYQTVDPNILNTFVEWKCSTNNRI